MTDNILLLGDLHVGSIYGMIPPDFQTDADPMNDDVTTFVQNRTQKALWGHWKKMLAAMKETRPKAILLNGDICEGPQRRGIGKLTVTSDLRIQAEMAVRIIKTLPKANLYFTQGTEYHSMEDRPLEQYIAERVGGEYGHHLLIDECGIRIYARHFINVSKSTWQYRTTPIARDVMLLKIHDSIEKYSKVQVAVFSHAHYFAAVKFRSQMGMVLPCWQTMTPYAVKNGIISPSDIGYITLRVGDPDDITLSDRGVVHLGGPPARVVGPVHRQNAKRILMGGEKARAQRK